MKDDICLSCVVLLQVIITIMQMILPVLGLTSIEQAANIRVYITLLSYLPAAIIVLRRNPILLLLPFVVYGVFALFNYALFPASHNFLESRQALTLTPVAILSAIFLISIRDFKIFLKVLLFFSRGIVIIAAFYVWLRHYSHFSIKYEYSMSFGYSLLLPMLYLFNRENAFDKLLSLILFVFVVMDGSRSPVVIAVVYYIIDIFFFSSYRSSWKLLFLVCVMAFVAYAYRYDMTDIKGSRTVYLFNRGELISHDSHRGEIYDIVLNRINERPLQGWGIGADRHIIKGYAHNIILELSLHYGVLLTSLLFLIFLIYAIKLFFYSKTLEMQGGRSMFLIMILYGFVPLMVSGSYLIEISFALMIGYIVRAYISVNKSSRLLSIVESIVNKKKKVLCIQ